ncbi:hypothetical protein ACN42_g86 [Penicillium freii]|uniref:Alpha-galactosidase n=1 Tax=Penicillium freii TaxID=48697 RepID=A0A124GTN7_PENFR|nr:hypothetical protein ACN42_g86 [Penicillium freii]
MGFNNWARFECDLNETFFTETAQAMLKGGLLDVGYGFLTLDDRWMLHDRVEDGSLEWDTDKFPHGIPWLANYMKRNGLHFGTYQEAGPRTRADAVTTTVSLARLGLSPQSGCNYDARNLVTDEVLTIDSAIEIQLDSHVAKVYRIALPKSCTKTTSTGMVFNTPSGLCMTASTVSVIFEKCSASDFQFWHVAATGEATKLKMSPLSDASVCLAAGDEDSLAKWQGGTGITWDHKYRVICAALLGDS